ncbi:MAG: BatD family protein [bacterium]|nr:protein BatD [Gammaproteobacteria bacterium]
MTRQTGNFLRACLFVVTSIAFTSITSSAFAQLSVTVDRTQITEADLVRLNIRVDNVTTSSNPDFGALERDFEILAALGPNQNSRISIVNGRQTSEVHTTWELRLRARRLGQLIIPAFKIGDQSSQPIRIEVVKQSAAMKQKMDQLVFFDTSVDHTNIYVQGQIIYTIRLFYIENISGDFPAPPELGDAVIETIESERRYDTITNGRRYYVLEKRYAIYPQRSGELVIPRQAFSGSRVGRGFFSTREPIMALSKPHTITVSPRPPSYQGKHWLPARSLEVTESWSQNPPGFKVGEPINRTLIISVEGLAASLLPVFENIEIEGAKTYKDPAVEDQTANENGIFATRSVMIGIVPTRAGTIRIPEISIPWWNTVTDKAEIATISSREFLVEASVNVQSEAPQIPVNPPVSEPLAPSTQPLTTMQTNPWVAVSATIGLLWLITVVLWWRQTARKKEKLLEPSDPDPAISETALFKRLMDACRTDDAITARNLLFLWGKASYPSIDSTRELAQITGSDALLDEISALETCLYSPSADSAWQGAKLAKLVSELKSQGNTKIKRPALVEFINPG